MGILSWFGPRKSAGKPDWLRRWVIPPGHDDPKLDEIRRAAAADVAEVREEGAKYFSPDGPGDQNDDL